MVLKENLKKLLSIYSIMMKNITGHDLFKKHDFDTIFSELYNLYRKNFLTLFIYSLIGILILQLGIVWLGFNKAEMLTIMQDNYSQPSMDYVGTLLLIVLGSLIIYTLIHVFITYFIMARQENPSITPLEALGASIRKYLINYLILVIIIILMMVIGAIVGVLALIIGSFLAVLYLGTSLFISGTILIAENTNPFDSISRSFKLSHKDFWYTLGLVVVFVLILFVINLILSAIIAIPGAVVFFQKIFSADNVSNLTSAGMSEFYNFGIIAVILSSIINALIVPLTPLFAILVYYRLRFIEKENSEPNH